jgi:uncharacterized protein (UPF0371 family)
MGVNRAGFGIFDDEAVATASKQEIIRRYFRYSCEYLLGLVDKETVQRVELLMEELGIKTEDRLVVKVARECSKEAESKNKGHDGIYCGAAIELKDGRIITGKNSPLIHASSSVILNAIKTLAGIPDNIHLLSPQVIESISKLKADVFGTKAVSLNLGEMMVALSMSTATNPSVQVAMEKLKELRSCEMHMTHIPTPGDETGLRKLGINLTTDPNFSTSNLL